MAVICQGCGQSFPVPAGYARNKIQCPGCGVICPVPAGAERAAPAAAGRGRAPRPAAPATPFDEAPVEADIEGPAPAPAPAPVLLMPCRRCGRMIRRLGECDCTRGLDDPIPEEPGREPPSLSLDDAPARPAAEEEDEGGYDLSEPIGPSCPECRREMVRGTVVCVGCGFNVKTRKKLKRTFTPINRVWDADRSLANRLLWLAAAQGFHFFLGAILYSLAGTWMPAIITWPLLTVMLCFLLGTYSRIELVRDERGRVTITKRWRTLFIPMKPEVIDVRGYEGVVSGPWKDIGFLEWFVLISLLPWGIIPGAVWYYYAMHLPHYSVALSENHGQTSEYIYRGRSQEQMNEIADAVADACGFRRIG